MAGAADRRLVSAPTPRPSARARPFTRRRLTELTAAAILPCLAFVGLFPYLYMLETAFKSNSQFNRNEATPTLPLRFGNFATAWREVAPYLLSSVIVAACAMLGCILLGSVRGFVLARYRFPAATSSSASSPVCSWCRTRPASYRCPC